LVQPFGELSSFCLVKDSIGQSTGNALFEYKDVSITEDAMQGLNGLDIGGSVVSVQRAPGDGAVPQYMGSIGSIPPVTNKVEPTTVIKLVGNVAQYSVK